MYEALRNALYKFKTYLLTYPKSASALPCEMNKNVLADVAGMIS